MKEEIIEYYTLRPNLKQLFGRKVTKELEFDEYTEDKKVHQTLKDCVLTTFITNESETSINGVNEKVITKEKTKIIQNLPEGTILIWSEDSGYIIPNLQMTTLDEIIEEAQTIKGIYRGDIDDIKRDENKDV